MVTYLHSYILNCLKKFFRFFENRDIHVTVVNFESPIPDLRTLKDSIWREQSKLIGVDINEPNQLKLLSLFSSRFKEEYEKFPKSKTNVPYHFFVNNGAFGPVDYEILYCMIRYFKPKKILEIGSGNSTYLSAQAIQENRKEGHECTLTAIEPYPNSVLKAGFPGLSKLITKQVQEVPMSEFSALGENDILFIDSSHTLKVGSDVQYEILEILPRLKKGVLIHFHDIFLPTAYPKKWVLEDLRFLNEQYVLQAFLMFNKSFEVLWAGSYMDLKHPSKLEAAFSSYTKGLRLPGSFWIRKTN